MELFLPNSVLLTVKEDSDFFPVRAVNFLLNKYLLKVSLNSMSSFKTLTPLSDSLFAMF